MYRYLVHVERGRVVQWRYRLQSTGDSVIINIGDKGKVEYNLDHEPIIGPEMETFYMQDLPTAEILARDLAEQKPNARIYITELRSVFQTGSTPVKISNYTEKGLVPR